MSSLKNSAVHQSLVLSLLSAALLVSACSPKDNPPETTATAANDEHPSPIDSDKGLGESPIQKKPTATTADEESDMRINQSTVAAPPIITPKSQIVTGDAEVVSKDINPVAAAVKQPSLLTNPTTAGTPEDTVKRALDTLYYGDAEKAAIYYQVNMPNFTQELKNTQYAFKQTVQSVTITDTKYNADKTKATVTGELMLTDQGDPAPLSYDLEKINGKWKILG
ncbi:MULTISPECIES: hypothetical protein [Psychrobacter]|uniref:hypothetical protein n=1 Tax=Psychrobacter TaxID=497 RepID=UPI00146F52F4|nr:MULTISPECIES: hypothetical protein [Psychrobacter]